jgi:hypothetical protein
MKRKPKQDDRPIYNKLAKLSDDEVFMYAINSQLILARRLRDLKTRGINYG